ncbi:MAG TPA: DUF1549 and DUF1553 domain-containing protein [Gemmatales bacterium]|nr:DUF1549 and DUF1553 domain-containing protein [Gemmatales bacterium]
MLSRLGWCLAGLLACVFSPALHATPANKKALEAYLGPFLKRPVDCKFCHLADAAGNKASPDEVDKPHNVFGARLKIIRKELNKAGKASDLEARLDAILQEDSDADGVSNLIELLTSHSPGDAKDKPTSEELKNIDKVVAEFAKYQKRYRWKPLEVVVRPTVPVMSPGELVRQPIDAFIIAERQAQNLTPRPEASPEVLLRRLYLDLTGLPPTMEERTAFLSDSSPDAYEKLVDRLLASPRYAERWARHWMDIWRYSDWAGYGAEIRESQPHIWHWRDWIVDSLHDDKGYDQMVREMLAGDEIAPEDDKTIRATGFLVRNWFKFNRNVWLDNTVEHTAKAFLGMTVNCARCHDHMYDPIRQDDYYSFRAFFEPLQVRIDRLPGQSDTTKNGLARVYDAETQAKTYLLIRGNEAMPDKDRLCSPSVPASFHGTKLAIQPVTLPRDAFDVERRLHVLQEAVTEAKGRLTRAQGAITDKHVKQVASVIGLLRPGASLGMNVPCVTYYQLDHQAAQAELLAAQLSLALSELKLRERQQTTASPNETVLTEMTQRQLAQAEARKTTLTLEATLLRTTVKKKPPIVEQLKQAQAQLKTAEERLQKPIDGKTTAAKYPDSSSGRRLALARWITDVNNPLAARVAVNHIWMRHFGQPLVSSVFDFGKNGQQPTHPALLDYLAAEFMESGWSLKKLHKLIVTSNTYRLDSTPTKECIDRDPDNRFYWRHSPQRMQAEVVRDSLLQLSDKLDLTQGGPELDQAAGLTTARRSLYYRHANEKQMTFLLSFDAPTPTECYRRVNSVVPQQALALANSSIAQEASVAIAKKLHQQLGSQATPSSFIDAGFILITGRHATEDEQKLCQQFLQEQEARGKSPSSTERARTSLILVLLNHHEFVTVR